MSLDVGTIVGYLKLDTTGVGKGIREAQATVRTGLSKMDTEGGRSGSATAKAFGDEFGKGIKGLKLSSLAAEFGKGLAAGFAVTKAVDWLKDAISAASDANETINKSSVIFGQNQAAMQSWARTAVTTLGMTTAGALEAAAGFGDMFSQLGFGSDQAAAMSRTIVQMAADLGSFNNLQTGDVLERIAAGFRGEYDSLQKLIPNISAARVEQEAMAATGKKSATSLTAQEKAAAVLAIVQKDGARAMGDFSRTADQTANSQKIAAARAQELAVKVGNMLLPAYTALVQFVGNQVIPALSGTVDMIQEAGAAIAPLASGVGTLIESWRGLPGPLQGATIGLLVFLALQNRLASFGASVQSNVTRTVKAAQSEIDTLRLRAMYAGDAAAAAGGGFRGMASAIGSTAGAGLRGAASGLLGVMGGPWGLAFTGATAALSVWLDKQSEGRQFVESLTSSLDEQTGAITDNTRATVAKRLQDKGTLDIARQMGVNIADVTSASLGQADAQERVNAAVKAFLAQQPASTYEAWLASANALTGGIDGANSATAEAIRKQQQLKAATGATSTATSGATSASGDYSKALSEQQTKADNAAKANDALLRSISDLADQMLGIRDAQRGYYQAIDDGNAALKTSRDEFVKTYLEQHKITKATAAQQKAAEAWADTQIKSGKALDITTEAGRRLQDSLDEVAKRTLGVVTETFKHRDASKSLADAVSTADKQVEDGRNAYIDMAVSMGMSSDEAGRLADALGLTRANVDKLAQTVQSAPLDATGKVTVDTSEGDARRDAFMRRLRDLDGFTATANIKVRADAGQALGMLQALKGLPGILPVSAALQAIAAANAQGSIRFAGIQAMASGDITRQATILRTMRPILWNEAPGGEAYIPLAPAKRARSLEIWRRTGDLLGAGAGAQTSSVRHETNVNVKTLYLRDADDVLDMAARQQVLASYGPTP